MSIVRGHRVAVYSVVIGAAIIAAVACGWWLAHVDRHDGPSGTRLLAVRSSGGGKASLTWEDVRAIETQIPSIRIAPHLRKRAQLISADQNWATELVGTTPDYLDLEGLHVAAGRWLDRSDTASSRVVVVGDTVVARLFGAQAAVGEVIRIENQPFTIIGVLAHRGMTPQGQDLDDVALVPIEAYAARFGIDSKLRFGGTVLVTATTRGETAHVAAELRLLLRERHRLAVGDDDDFVIRDSNPE